MTSNQYSEDDDANRQVVLHKDAELASSESAGHLASQLFAHLDAAAQVTNTVSQ